MFRPRILYYSLLAYQPAARALLEDNFEVIERQSPDHDDDETLAGVEACFAPLGFTFDAAKMDRCPKLRAILTNTTGVPHVDMAAAAQRGIQVFSLKDEQAFLDTITPTAEHTFGLMLALTRNLPRGFEAVKAGVWNRFDHGGRAMLSRLSLGIVGLGRLGRKVARYGDAFGMTVKYYDPYVEVPTGGPARCATLAELVAASDVVTLHAPANDETADLISADVMAQFRPHAVFINTARAELVDEAALLAALEDGRLAGAAVDVLRGEYAQTFDPSTHPLVQYARSHDNLIITPHIGGSTQDAWSETQARVVELAIDFFSQGDER
jgi:D-3-phosphoglycerate dehydrogenase